MGIPNEQQKVLWFASLNINGFRKVGWEERKGLCSRIMKEMKSELLGVQEFLSYCKNDFDRAGVKLEWIISEPMGKVHNAIGYNLERFTVLDSGTIPLSPTGKMEPAWGGGMRCMQFALLEDSIFGTEILFVNFHLDHISTEARKEGAIVILKFLEKYEDVPTLITADANISVDSPFANRRTYEQRLAYELFMASEFEDCWMLGNPHNAIRPNTFHAFKGDRYTIPDEYGTWDTDINLVSKHFDVMDCTLVKTSEHGMYPSDHYFLTSLVRMKK